MTETAAKADRCKRLLDDPDLRQAFADVKSAIHKQIDDLKPSQVEDIVECKRRLHLLESVKANLYQAVQDGKLEAFRAREQERPPFLGDLSKWRKKMRL